MEFYTPLIIGVGIVCMVLAYLMNTLDEKHWVLKMVILLFIASSLLLIPKASIDATTVCESVVANSTAVTSTITSYEYESFCYTRDETTSVSFLETYNLMYYIIIGYMIVSIALWGMMKMRDAGMFRRRR